ncbi:MAG: hypothetical protein SFX73_39915 [Kofleriaceae bacterium]|nr:hypothetical protein [Kofleriaceae bacterium]
MRATFASVLVLLAAPASAQAPGASDPVSQAPGAGPPGATAPTTPPTTSAPEEPSEYGAPTLAQLDVETMPAQCRTLGKEANAKARTRALTARLSLATCLADAAIEGLSLIDGQESVLLLEEAIAPSRALLDEVIANAEPENQLMAQRQLTVMYAGIASRMLQTVPAPVDKSEAAQALRDIRLQNVETMLGPWREAEGSAHAAIVKLAAAYPRLAKDKMYAQTIATSRAKTGAPTPP